MGNGRANGRATGQIFLFGGPLVGPSAVLGGASGDVRAGEARTPRSRGGLGSRGEAELLTPRAGGKEVGKLRAVLPCIVAVLSICNRIQTHTWFERLASTLEP